MASRSGHSLPVLFGESVAVKTGAGVSAFTVLGADAITVTETGTGIAPFTADEQRDGAGTGIAPFVASGTQVTERSRAAIAESTFAASGADVAERVETGTAVLDNVIAAGVSVETQVGTGNAISARVGSGTKAITRSRANTVITAFVGSGERAVEHLRTGLVAIATFTVDGYRVEQQQTTIVVDTTVAVHPITTITGACTDPVISNETTGDELRFWNLTMVTGDELVIDHLSHEVLLNDGRVFCWGGTFFPLRSENTIRAGARVIGAGFSAEMFVRRSRPQLARTQHGVAQRGSVAAGRPESITVSRRGDGVLIAAARAARNGQGHGELALTAEGAVEVSYGG